MAWAQISEKFVIIVIINGNARDTYKYMLNKSITNKRQRRDYQKYNEKFGVLHVILNSSLLYLSEFTNFIFKL
jgi:hypothetical protein